MNTATQFWNRMDKTGTCWLWQGAKSPRNKNGHLLYQGKDIYAHRLAWILTHGEIPAGMMVFHHCGTDLCCNPDHLFLAARQKGKHNTPESFWSHVLTTETCWIWQGMKQRGDYPYGLIAYQGKRWMTHRLAWTLTHGPIPDGMFVLHRCDNPPCVNPAHLFLGSILDNILDAIQKGRWGKRGRLTARDVASIRALSEQGVAQTTIAAIYGVHQTNIHAILRRKTWRGV
jgi:HNH endonuclease